MIALTTAPILAFALGDLIPQGGTRYTVNWPHGATTVLSVQPDGSYQTRPQGTAGAYEVCQKSGDKLVFSPRSDGTVYVVPIIEGLS